MDRKNILLKQKIEKGTKWLATGRKTVTGSTAVLLHPVKAFLSHHHPSVLLTKMTSKEFRNIFVTKQKMHSFPCITHERMHVANVKHALKLTFIKKTCVQARMFPFFLLVFTIDTPDHSEIYEKEEECDDNSFNEPGYCKLNCGTEDVIE